MKKIIGFVRTSTMKQANSIKNQRDRIKEYANGRDMKLVDIIEEEGISGNALKRLGFDIKPGNHPIVPIMLYDAHLAQKMSNELLDRGIYVIGFFFPVVPKGKARIRVQLSAAHSKEHLDKAIVSFIKIGRELNVIK